MINNARANLLASPPAAPQPVPDPSASGVSATEAALIDWLLGHGSALVGFSGGVDSTYLAAVALDALGPDAVLAVIGRSASYPEVQWENAHEIAGRIGLPLLEVITEELADPRYAANPTNRCYFCKSELWTRLIPVATERGLAVIVDGTNADDLGGHRPGRLAAAERAVRSPLAELGFGKDEIRRLSRARGLPSWSQPASPCLSSRIPYGTAITTERLARVERAEAALRTAGIVGDLRVRDHDDLARIEMTADALARWTTPGRAAALVAAVCGAGFSRVAIDLRGFRSGSLNALGNVPTSALAGALLARGIRASVETRGSLAVLLPLFDPAALAVSSLRETVLVVAREHGVSHVALELDEGAGAHAAVRGD